jgi:hypothetical protein
MKAIHLTAYGIPAQSLQMFEVQVQSLGHSIGFGA